jgi:hypothetical protein
MRSQRVPEMAQLAQEGPASQVEFHQWKWQERQTGMRGVVGVVVVVGGGKAGAGGCCGAAERERERVTLPVMAAWGAVGRDGSSMLLMPKESGLVTS